MSYIKKTFLLVLYSLMMLFYPFLSVSAIDPCQQSGAKTIEDCKLAVPGVACKFLPVTNECVFDDSVKVGAPIECSGLSEINCVQVNVLGEVPKCLWDKIANQCVQWQNLNTFKGKSESFDQTDPTFIETNSLDLIGTTLQDFIGRIIQLLMGVIGTIALVMIIYGGGLWMTAAGSSEKEGRAMKIMFTAGIGVVIILSSYAIVTFVFNAL